MGTYYCKKEISDEKKKAAQAFSQRYCLLWERDREDYNGKIKLKYE